MADVSRSVHLSKKLSSLIDDHTSSKHAYDGVFSSSPAPTKSKLSASRIEDIREIFTPSSVSLGSSIPILDLPVVDLAARAVSGADYAGVFGGFADNDAIGPPPDELIRLAKTMPKREAHPPRIPVQTRMPSKSQEFSFGKGNVQTSSLGQARRVPSKSQEFSSSNGNDQTSSTAQARRVPSKSQEFSFSNGNDQTSSAAQVRRMPSKSQEFSCNYGNDQTSNSAQVTRMPSKSQEFSSNYGNDQRSTSGQTVRMPSNSQESSRNYEIDQRSTPAQTVRMPSKSQEFSRNYEVDQRSTPAQKMRNPSNRSEEFPFSNGNDHGSTPTQMMRMPSKSEEFSCKYGNDQTSSPVQTRRMPSKSQEFPCIYGNDKASSPVQTRRMPSKSQEFSYNHENDQTSSSALPRRESSISQEFSRNLSNNYMSSSPLQAGRPYIRGDEISGDSPNGQVSESTLPHETVDGVKHVSVSYHQTKQLSKDGTDNMTHIAHLHAVPGYTLLFDDEAGPVRKAGFDKAKGLSMDDADLSNTVGKVSKQGKHTRAVSDLGTIKQASDYDYDGGDSHFATSHDTRLNRSMSVSNSPQSSGGSDYFKKPAGRRPNGSKKNQEKNAVRDPFPLLELDVNSDAAVSASVMKKAIEEAEEKIRWAKEFLMGLESMGYVRPTLKDSFKVKTTSDTYEAYGPKQNGSLKVNATRQKKCINEDKVRRRNSHLNVKASGVNSHAIEVGGERPKDDLHCVAAQVEATMRIPSAQGTLEESPDPVQLSGSIIDGESVYNPNAREESNLTEKSVKHEGVGEWEAAKHISQIFTGVKNRFVSFISKQADAEKVVIQKEAPSKSESLEQERAYKVQNVDTVQDMGADPESVEEKVEMNHSTCPVVQNSAQESIRFSVDMEIPEAEKNKYIGNGATSSPDVEIFTSKQYGQSELKDVAEYIGAKKTENSTDELNQDVDTEVKGELLQEVQVQHHDVFDATMQPEHESQMGLTELEDHDKKDEIVNQVQGVEPIKERVNESIDNEAVNSRQIEGYNLKEKEIPKDAQARPIGVGMVEATCVVEEHSEGVVEVDELHASRGDVVAGLDVSGAETAGLTEVYGDVSEHDELLAAVDDANKQDKLIFSKNEEAREPDEKIQCAPGVRFPSEDTGMRTESTAVPFEPKEDIEESKSVQRDGVLLREGICEQARCSVDVAENDDSELDEYLPANDDILEQDESISSTRNEDATEHDNVSLYALDVELPTQEVSRTEATSTPCIPEENIEKPRSVQMADDVLSGGYKFEVSGSSSEAADKYLKHDDYLPPADDAREKDEHSCLNGNAEAYDQENQYAQEVKVAAEEERSERMATDAGTSEFEGTEEEPSLTQKVNESVGGAQITEILMPAEETIVLDESEKKIEQAHEVHRCRDGETAECDTVFEVELKHCDEETGNFSTHIHSDSPDDKPDVSTREAYEASELDVGSHNGELSHKRRRWFQKKEEVGELKRSGIYEGKERALEANQENAEDFKVEDRVDICVDEIANESGEGVHMEPDDAGSGQEQEGDGLHSTEGTHRRRRWFENGGEKIQLKPSPFNGVGVTEEMDHETAPEFKQKINSQIDADQLVNERKDGADVMDSNMANDQVESRASTEAGHRRRRWFESTEKSGAAQRPGPAILENNEVTAELETEIAMKADTAKHELRDASTSGDLASTIKREEHNKEREKEKERLVVERAIREVRQRAFTEARDRATAEALKKAAAASQDKQGKASSEAKLSSDKASMDAKLKSERAAVERATSEARERALQKSISDKAGFKSFEKDPKNQNSGPSCSSGYSTSGPSTSDRSNGAVNESPQRRKAISERNKRTSERAAKALEEKNIRDVIAQKEQAERNRFANTLDADVKRWSAGKEGNLRSLLSTLQYILSSDSGWQPIPLTDLVSTTAIRKAYKRAALCVHPDKLQQRGATIQQKYICEKVFDLLKDAWNKLNPEDR